MAPKIQPSQLQPTTCQCTPYTSLFIRERDMGECPHYGPTPRPRTLGTRLSSTPHHPNYLKPPAFGQGAPLRQPEWQWRDHLPARPAERKGTQCLSTHPLSRALPRAAPGPGWSAGPRAAAGGAATEPALLGREPPRRLLAPPLRRGLSSRERVGRAQPQGVCYRAHARACARPTRSRS